MGRGTWIALVAVAVGAVGASPVAAQPGPRAELHLEGQMVVLDQGDSWVVPAGASHSYRILERFTAVEATSPPAHAHARDEG